MTYLIGGVYSATTLADAKEIAQWVFAKSGTVLGIEEAS